MSSNDDELSDIPPSWAKFIAKHGIEAINNIRTSGILISKKVDIPKLDSDAIKLIDNVNTKIITRHFKETLLDITLAGSFRFGTISRYRPADNNLVGRFSDTQEGLQCNVFRSRTGLYNGRIDDGYIRNTRMIGIDDPISIEYQVNDYCSCSSIGGFSKLRANQIRDRGNPDIGAYAVYDLNKLRVALKLVFKEKPALNNKILLARNVEYGEKNRSWDVEENFNIKLDRDQLAVWLGTTFVKSIDYQHEEEIRILVVDPNKVACLDEKAEPELLNDPRIADCIIEYGKF